MCTLTLIPISTNGATNARLMFNRDEMRSRPLALPPRRLRAGTHEAVMPLDPQSGGTWIGANSAALAQFPLESFEPFQLLLLDLECWASLQWDGRSFTLGEKAAVVSPVLLTSSNLGDALVAQPRRDLFDRVFAASGPWQRAQESFHRHQWPERPELSVCMSRPDSGTLSQTIIELEARGVQLTCFQGPPDQALTPEVVVLTLLI